VFMVYCVSETAHVELKSGRVQAPINGYRSLLAEKRKQIGGRGLHSFLFPLNLSLPCPFPLNLSSL